MENNQEPNWIFYSEPEPVYFEGVEQPPMDADTWKKALAEEARREKVVDEWRNKNPERYKTEEERLEDKRKRQLRIIQNTEYQSERLLRKELASDLPILSEYELPDKALEYLRNIDLVRYAPSEQEINRYRRA